MNQAGRKIWLIGASAGIGEALAHELSQRGATLALSARNKEALERLGQALGGHPTILPFDATDRAAIEAAKNQLIKEWGSIDCMVYVAGVYTPMHAYEIDEAKANQTFTINFNGAFNALAATVPAMLEKQKGHVVIFSSVAGFIGLPNSLCYGASKAALTNMAETMYLELTDKKIKVQVVHPGFVKTRLTDQNEFKMPFLIEVKEAAKRVADGMQSNRFEIHFPRRFTYFMKFLRVLPYPAYFWITRKLLG